MNKELEKENEDFLKEESLKGKKEGFAYFSLENLIRVYVNKTFCLKRDRPQTPNLSRQQITDHNAH